MVIDEVAYEPEDIKSEEPLALCEIVLPEVYSSFEVGQSHVSFVPQYPAHDSCLPLILKSETS